MTTCQACTHAERFHKGACRVTGCPCESFVAPVIDVEPVGRSVTFSVPDGYAVEVRLTPLGEPDGA